MKTILCVSVLLLVGCTPAPSDTLEAGGQAVGRVSDGGPVTIRRVAVIEDDTAYDHRRSVYIITDKETGQQWIGVSGVGVSERGSHIVPMGKTMLYVPDER